MPTLERHIEAYALKRVRTAGGEIRKVKWIGRVGAPDRVVFINGVTWVEFKAPGKYAEGHQYREHARMRDMGARVRVIDSYEDVDRMMKDLGF